ncbi:hypothetical protein MTR_2g055280 [Medicago truncatula]|uniref:Uncharacterized protein n=1 Tax=Medicago truncatula TaxID=3880 RepID=A0A072V8M8_MEDTR|nr:hypothetical protein MTR_2g055280 [Medicago truncatula]
MRNFQCALRNESSVPTWVNDGVNVNNVNVAQKTQIVLLVPHHGVQFIRICLSLHGSRSVEKLNEDYREDAQTGSTLYRL